PAPIAGVIDASPPPLRVPSSQWAPSALSGTGPPCSASDADPVKVLPAARRLLHESAVPMPRTWPSSCVATEKKSVRLNGMPAPVALKYQLVVVSKLREPNAGA